MVKVLVIDDIRIARPHAGVEFTHVTHPMDAVSEIYTKEYDEIWFDHDLGYDEAGMMTTIVVAETLAYDDEFKDYHPQIAIHSMNPVGVANLKRILEYNGRHKPYIVPAHMHSSLFEKEF